MTLEQRLMLLLLKPPASDRIGETRRFLGQGVRWDSLFQSASRNAVIPQVCGRLIDGFPELIPPTVLNRLRAARLLNAKRSLVLAEETANLLETLGREGIPAIPYKGPALALFLHGDVASRQYSDLDILVPSKVCGQAREVLLAQGHKPRRALSKAKLKAALFSQCHHQLISSEGHYVELHWDIAPRNFPVRFDMERLFRRARPFSFLGKPALFPCPEDLVLMLGIHGGKDYWERLSWIFDLVPLAQTRTDWEKVLRDAKAIGVERMLLLGYFLANDLFGAALPEPVQKALEGRRGMGDLARHVHRQVFDGVDYRHHTFRSWFFHLMIRERNRDKIRCLGENLAARAVPTSKEWEKIELPDSLFFLYYLLRPVRLLLKYLLAPITYLFPSRK